jgi:hypothetical protein
MPQPEQDATSQSNLGQMQVHSSSLVHRLYISTVLVWQVRAVALTQSSGKIFLLVTYFWSWKLVVMQWRFLDSRIWAWQSSLQQVELLSHGVWCQSPQQEANTDYVGAQVLRLCRVLLRMELIQ